VRDFRHAAAAALEAGADGVEIHAANGYLIHQFSFRTMPTNARMATGVRSRIEFASRSRWPQESPRKIGGERTGIIISPGNPLNDILEEDVDDLYSVLLRALSPLGLAYLNVVHGGNEYLIDAIRRDWESPLLLNRRGADLETRIHDVESGLADVITVGTQTLANPDLVERIKNGSPLNEPDRTTFYGGDERGYIDYPTMEEIRYPSYQS